MRHKAFEDLHTNIAIFQEVAQMLDSLGFDMDGGDCCPGESYDFHLGWIDIGDYDKNEDYERISFSHWLYLHFGEKDVPKVILTMSFCDGGSEGPVIHIQHQSDTWSVISEYSRSINAPLENHQSLRHNELCLLLFIKPGETHVVTEERAFAMIRVMSAFFQMTKNENARAKKTS